jgi:uncharacterized protein
VRALFDISMLLALLDQDHLRHEHARAWYARERHHGWASCPLSQNGFLRIMSQRSYTGSRSIGDALMILRSATVRAEHEFWPDDVSILDAGLIDYERLLSPKKITDVYLLALAVKHGGRLVTLDTGISVQAVRGATAGQLVVV